MRIWSIHPQFLDPAGLVAAWREGLLAQAVLGGLTRGYTKHPQLIRFREHSNPSAAIATYLHHLLREADRRGYRFDASKVPSIRTRRRIEVTTGQMDFEWEHLEKKVRLRNRGFYREILRGTMPAPHPIFVVIAGGRESWERTFRG